MSQPSEARQPVSHSEDGNKPAVSIATEQKAGVQFNPQNTGLQTPPYQIHNPANLNANKAIPQPSFPSQVGGRTVQTGMTNMPVYPSSHPHPLPHPRPVPTQPQAQPQPQPQTQPQPQLQPQQHAVNSVNSDSSGHSAQKKQISEEERQIVRSLQTEFENTFKASQYANMFNTNHEVYKRAIKNYVFGMIPENLQKKLEVTPITKFSPLEALEYSVRKHSEQLRIMEQQQHIQAQQQQQAGYPKTSSQVVSPHLLRPVNVAPPQQQSQAPLARPDALQQRPPSQPQVAQGVAVSQPPGTETDEQDRKRSIQMGQVDQDNNNIKRPRLMEASMGMGSMGGNVNPQMYNPQYNKMYGYMGRMGPWQGGHPQQQQRGPPFPRGVPGMMQQPQQQQQQQASNVGGMQVQNQLQVQTLGEKVAAEGQMQTGMGSSGVGSGLPKQQTAAPVAMPSQVNSLPLPMQSQPSNIMPEVRGRSTNSNLLPRPSRMHARHFGMDDGKVLPLRGLQALIRNNGFLKNYEFDLAVEQEIQDSCQDFLSDVIAQGLSIAKRRKSNKLEVSDLEVALELKYHLKIPGFTKSNNALLKRQFNRPQGSDIHRKIQADVRKSQVQAQKAAQKQVEI